jgi:hypothetical protein
MSELINAHLMSNERTSQTLRDLIPNLAEIVRLVRTINHQLDHIGMNNRAERTILAGEEQIMDDAAECAVEAGQCLN